MKLAFRPLRPESDELLHLDLLRFVASLAIVGLHFARFTSLSGWGEPVALRAAVDLFFAVSGFVIAYVYGARLAGRDDYLHFIWRRVARLGPLHWATLIFFVLLGLAIRRGLMHSDHPEEYSWACLLPNALAVQAWGICKSTSFNGVSWSISAEFGMYLAAPIIFLATLKRPTVGLIFTVTLFLTLSSLRFFSVSQLWTPWYDWTYDFGVIRAVPSFLVGVLIYRFKSHLENLPRPRLLMAASLLSFVVGAALKLDRAALILILYTAVCGAVAADLKRYPLDLVGRCGALGQLTYSIYMIHPIIISVFLTFVGQRLLHLAGIKANVWVAVCILLTIIISYASLMLFETPARRFMAGSIRRGLPAGSTGQ